MVLRIADRRLLRQCCIAVPLRQHQSRSTLRDDVVLALALALALASSCRSRSKARHNCVCVKSRNAEYLGKVATDGPCSSLLAARLPPTEVPPKGMGFLSLESGVASRRKSSRFKTGPTPPPPVSIARGVGLDRRGSKLQRRRGIRSHTRRPK